MQYVFGSANGNRTRVSGVPALPVDYPNALHSYGAFASDTDSQDAIYVAKGVTWTSKDSACIAKLNIREFTVL